MKKYYTSSKQDPNSDDFNPKVVLARPLHSDNDELNDLRQENYKLKKQLEERKSNDPKPKTPEVKVIVDTIDGTSEGLDVEGGVGIDKVANIGDLRFLTVPATEKSPSGGLISKPKAKSKAKGSKQGTKNSTGKKS